MLSVIEAVHVPGRVHTVLTGACRFWDLERVHEAFEGGSL